MTASVEITTQTRGRSNVFSSTLRGGEQDGSRSAGNTAESLTHTLDDSKEGLMPHSTDTCELTHQERCLEYLALAATDYEKARRARLHYIDLARRYGLPWTTIGPALGISDVAARSLHVRAVARG